MKFVSWNVNGLRACLKKGFEESVLGLDADFICLQETKMEQGQADVDLGEGILEFWNSAEKKGYSQVLWLDGRENKYIEEVGSMNMFFKFKDALVTPPLNGSILGGITRDSILQLARKMGVPTEERRITVQDVFDAYDRGELEEAFGTGTAAVVSPVGRLMWEGREIEIAGGQIGALTQRFYDELTGIQYGTAPDPRGGVVPVA